MCGIGGIITRNGGTVRPEELRAMAERLGHRGPDARGFAAYSLGASLNAARDALSLDPADVGLVHLRLSIIDTTDCGWQPMRSSDDRYAIVFNGEIYNYLELRDELVRAGYTFRSASDTEVLLNAWAEWGPACLTRLVGMFAFAILDTHDDTLTLARDGFGIKPLFYFADDNRFVFASELKALMPLVSGRRRVDAGRVFEYLRSGITDGGGATLLESVRQIPPGHWGTVQLRDAKPPQLTQFWRPERREPLDLSYDEAVSRARELFLRSVQLHLRSDVPVGACLSGGIDSSAIVCAMREIVGDSLDLHTFTYIADSPEHSEAPWASIVAGHVRAVAHNVMPNAGHLIEDLETLIACQDEPFASTSIYAQHRVFRLIADNNVKVVLDGQGADELLGGYPHHSGARLASIVRRGRLGKAASFWRSVPSGYGGTRYGRAMALPYLLPTAATDILRRVIGRSVMPPWLNADWFASRGTGDLTVRQMKASTLTEELAEDVRGNLPMLLRYEDRNSMHFSVESRVPFLTPELCDFLLSLPDDFIIGDDATSKAVLRSALRGIVPDVILDRRDKVGFQTPEWQWMRSAHGWAERILNSEAARALPVFRHDELLNGWRRAVSSPRHYHPWVWRWINFIRWVEVNEIEL